MRRRLRALFVNEGALGREVLGHASAGESLRRQLGAVDLDARLIALPPMSRATRLAVRGIPGAGHADLDLQPLRWHLAQSARARVAVERALRRAPADVLHIHTHTLSLLARGLLRRVPTVVSLDATVWDWHEFGIWRRVRAHSRATLAPSIALERRALEAAAGVLAWTSWSARAVARSCPAARVVEHHPGVDLERYRPAPHRRRERPRVLFVGGRFAAKGGDDLIAALAPLAGRELDVDIVTQARVPPQPGVRVHRLPPGDPAIVCLYQQADVFCLPTHGDAVPFSVVEAMASGAAVVASGIGGIPDLLGGGRYGRLIAPGDRGALVAAVRALLADDTARSTLAAAARRRCEDRYDVATQARRLVSLLHDAAALDGRPAAS